MWILFTGVWMTRIARGPGCEPPVLMWIFIWCQPAGSSWSVFRQRHSDGPCTKTLQGADLEVRGSFQASGACFPPPSLWPLQKAPYWVSRADTQLVKPLGPFSPSPINSPDALFLTNSSSQGCRLLLPLQSIHHLFTPSPRSFPLQGCLEPLFPKCGMR